MILVLRRQRQVEFEISLVYTGSSRAARATEKSVLKNKNRNKKQKKMFKSYH